MYFLDSMRLRFLVIFFLFSTGNVDENQMKRRRAKPPRTLADTMDNECQLPNVESLFPHNKIKEPITMYRNTLVLRSLFLFGPQPPKNGTYLIVSSASGFIAQTVLAGAQRNSSIKTRKLIILSQQ